MTADHTAQMASMLSELGARLGLTGLGLTADGTCSFDFDGQFDVTLEVDANAGFLHLFGELDRVPHDNPDYLLRLLVANLSETGEARFSVDPGAGRVTYQAQHRIDGMDTSMLETLLENFLADCAAWNRRLGSPEGFVGETADQTKAPLPSQRFIRA